MNRNFSLLIKPASWRCNLGCPSCFYSKKSELFRDGGLRMNDEVLAALTRKFLGLELPLSCFGWQGGECTLMGLDFFRKALDFQRKFAKPGQRVSNSIQTNATLLDDEWGRFFHENNILTGVSLDGPPEMHDRSRPWPDGRGSYADVLRGLEALRRNRAEFNVLTLVSAVNQEHPKEIYRYLKSLDVKYHQYIECVEFDSAGSLKPCSAEPRKWGRFLCELFDEWYPADVRKVSIRLFDSILSRLVDGAPSLCSMGGDCRQYFVVEHNGDLYPCDFHVSPEWKLGNIGTDDLLPLFESPLYREFGTRKSAVHENAVSVNIVRSAWDAVRRTLPRAIGSRSARSATDGRCFMPIRWNGSERSPPESGKIVRGMLLGGKGRRPVLDAIHRVRAGAERSIRTAADDAKKL